MTILTYAIDNAPAVIHSIASALGVERIAEVPPRYYTRANADKTIRTFDREKAERNFDKIAAICDGATWIITDIEKKHRDAVRHPDNFNDSEVKEAVDQYIACWSWFRSNWPNALIFEWSLSNAREPGRNTFAEKLILKHLDGIAVSCFWHDKANWPIVRRQIIAHANSLVASTDKIVIAGIREQYNVHNADGTSTTTPVPRAIVDTIIEVSLDARLVMFWSNTYRKFIDDPMSTVNARIVEMLAEMRLQSEEQTP